MTTLALASRNRRKTAEMETLLSALSSDIKVLSLDDIGYTGEIEETGATFEENAVIKASVPAKLGYIGIADDSGLCVDALDGRPGVYSARYADKDSRFEGVSADERNNEKLLLELENVPDGARGAKFVSVIALVCPEDVRGGMKLVARGECAGSILRKRIGDGGFGYDPLFWYEPLKKSFAELDADEKNRVSHRGAAMRAFAGRFEEFLRREDERR